MRTLTIAAIQMTCLDGKIEKNLEHATTLVKQAAEKGAELILFPEFMSQGYWLGPELWDAAEPFDGPTTRWLCEMGKKYNCYIGSSFLEAKDGHFLNTFVLAAPSGKIAGTVYKREPSMWEAYFFKGVKGNHYIDTEIGRIGVGICFDNHTYEVASAIAASNIDLMLMPHSYCTPTVESKMTSRVDIDRLNSRPVEVAKLYNKLFGVPVVICNKSGKWDSPVPNTILGTPEDFSFSGRSTIIDADGTIKQQLDDKEDIAIATVELDGSLKRNSTVPKYSRYVYPGPLGREIIRIMEWSGGRSYNKSTLRKQKANSFKVLS
jgi:N-carbamoylputrescine amidase